MIGGAPSTMKCSLTDFMNLKIKSAQSFGCTYMGSLCVRVFIEMSDYIYMSICVCTM
jgi:hypothetical protein